MKQIKQRMMLLVAMLLSVFSISASNSQGDGSSNVQTYEIGTASELEAFANAVANGETNVNANLTADIDYTGCQTVVGSSEIDYDGTFDGQGHKVTVAFENNVDSHVALFARIGHHGVIKNLITDGTITTSTKYSGGIVGANFGKIINCTSFVTINTSVYGDATDGGIAGLCYEGSRIEYCLSAAKIHGPEVTNNCAALVGWLDGTTSIEHCLSIAEMDLSTVWGSDSFCRHSDNLRGNGGNYFLNMFDSYNASKCTQITEDDLKSGYVCYALNGDQTDIHWYQNVGEDDYPVLDNTHQQVYAHGTVNCAGQSEGETTYDNNSANAAVVPAHNYENGYCLACNTFSNTYAPEVDGVFQISTASQLKWFCMMQDQNFNYRSAELTADIDYPVEMGDLITSGAYYYGTFNGNFHTLTLNLNYPCCASLFNNLSGTVNNLKVAGTITTDGVYAAAICAHLWNGNIYNCTSSVDIESKCEGDGTHGGICAKSEGGGTIAFCIFDGKMKGETTTNCGGIVGWTNGGTNIIGCIVEPTEVSNGILENVITRNPSVANVEGCYYKLETVKLEKTEEYDPTNGAIVMTADAMKSGEACFKMNGDQSNIGWTQNLGSEDRPNNEGKSAQVYSQAEIRCDGKIMDGGPYTNDASLQSAIPDHQYENGFCTICGSMQPGYKVEPDADGYYNISNPSYLCWFANTVNNGENTIKGRLTADIDMTGYCDKFTPIGSESYPFNSIFDGQGHKISNLSVIQEAVCAGLFGYVQAPCTIENLILDNTCSIHGSAYSGLIGESNAMRGDVYLTNLGNEGSVSTTYGNAGGIIGCCMGSMATFYLTGCYTTGDVNGGYESGALSGWLGSNAVVRKCWSCSSIGGFDSDATSFARYSSARFENCYYQNETCYEVPTVTAEQVKNGELTYLLNGNSFKDPVWYQTIDVDPHPVWDGTHGVVYQANGVFADVHDDVTFKTFVQDFTSSEKDYAQNVLAQRSLTSEYQTAIDGLANLSSMQEVAYAYENLAGLKSDIQNSEAAYAVYQSAIQETQTYLEEHPDLQGESFEFLSNYLKKDDAPGTYPNGTYGYIMANLLLNQGEITAETEYVKQLLNIAILNNSKSGSDITQLLKNPAFVDGFDGWEGRTGTGFGSYGDNDMRAVECAGDTMDMYQTLTGLKNGVYELKVNGAFLTYVDPAANQYAAMLYLNDNKNYFQADIEDMIPEDQAVDGQNCFYSDDLYVTNGDGQVGYVMSSIPGASIAFSAGRYQNSILVNVTDGMLKVGIMQPGTRAVDSDWLGFGNLKLTYCGEMSEAGDYLDEVLASMSARANTILYKYIYDYDLYPNFSQVTKDALQATIDAVATAADNDAKYALIQKFSDLFQEVHDCKEAYTDMIAQSSFLVNAALELYNATDAEGNPLAIPLMSQEEYDNILSLNDQILAAYDEGAYTFEQAKNVDGLSNNSIAAPFVEGAYQLSTASNVVWYSAMVNSGNCKDAVLTADIDMGKINMTPIGSAGTYFTGTFDGQGHKISNLVMSHSTSAVGFIGLVKAPATIKNFVLDSTCSIKGDAYVGIIGESAPISGEIHLECLGNEGSVTAEYDNAGGIIGCCMQSAATFIMKNCYVTGTVNGGYESAALSGWVGSLSTIEGCYSTALVNGSDDIDFLVRYDGGTSINNCYDINGSPDAIQISTDQVTSGKLCYLLNGGSLQNAIWYQTLGTDDHPVLDSSHGIVKNEGDDYVNVEDILQVEPGTILEADVAENNGDDDHTFNLVMKNSSADDFTDVQFDLYLPAGLSLAEDVKLSEDGLTCKLTDMDNGHYHLSLNDDNKQAISGTDGVLLALYYKTTADIDNMVLPIVMKNIVLTRTDETNVKIACTTSYVKVGNPTNATLALEGVIPSFVNDALASETAISKLDLSAVTASNGTFSYVVGRDVIAPTTEITANVKVEYPAPADGCYASICLPFAADVNCYTLTSVENGWAHFDSATAVEKDQAAIITDEVSIEKSIVLRSIETKSVADGYYINGSKMYHGNVSVPALRGCWQFDNGGAVKGFVLDDDETAISAIEVSDANKSIYNVAGQKLTQIQRGVNIVNGKKLIVK